MEKSDYTKNSEIAEPRPILFYALYCIELLLKRAKFHVYFVGAISVLVVLIALLQRNFYTATAEIIPPESSKSTAAASLLGGSQALLSYAGLGDLSRNKYTDLCLSISNSQKFKRDIISKFNLIPYYKFKPRDKIEFVIKHFSRYFSVVENDLGILEISFTDKSPELCSLVVDYSAKLLDSIFLETQKQRAATEQAFVQQKLAETRMKFDSLTKAFVDFQVSRKAYDPELQAERLIDQISKIEAQKFELLSAKQVSSKMEGSFSHAVRRIEATERALKAIMDSLEHGSLQSSPILNNLKVVPEVAIEFKLRKAELTFTAEMISYFNKFSEELRLKASTDYKQTQILTPGYKPQKKSGPPRTAIVLLVFFLGNIVSLFVIVFYESLLSDKNRNGAAWHSILRIRSNLSKLVRFRR